MRDDSDMGPINSAGQYRKVMGYIESGNAEGARLLTGGSRPDGQDFATGYWVRPTVLADVDPHMRTWRVEIFGPVLSVSKWNSVDEATRTATGADYGLPPPTWNKAINKALNTSRTTNPGLHRTRKT